MSLLNLKETAKNVTLIRGGGQVYVLVRREGSRCRLYLAESFRENGKIRREKLYLGSVTKGVVPIVKKAFEGRLEALGTTIDPWRAYALWYWSRALGEAKREGDVERHSYAKELLKWLLGGVK